MREPAAGSGRSAGAGHGFGSAAPLLAAALALGGCYGYAPATPAAVPAGARVRVTLTEAGTAGLTPLVGSSVGAVEGEVLRLAGDTLVVRGDRLLTTPGVAVEWSGGELAVPPDWRRGVERRRLAVGRTALLAGGGAAAAAGLLVLVRNLNDSGGNAGDGGGPPGVSRTRP